MSEIVTARSGTILTIQFQPAGEEERSDDEHVRPRWAELLNIAARDDGIRVRAAARRRGFLSAGNDLGDFLKNPPRGMTVRRATSSMR